MSSLPPILDIRAKIGRANKQLEELTAALEPFTRARTHPVRQKEEAKGNKLVPVWRVQISGHLDRTYCAVVAGDILHNLRSALDYAVVALNPPQQRSRVMFPIIEHDVWQRDSLTRKYVKRNKDAIKRRAFFRDCTQHIHPEARAIIFNLQPCIFAPGKVRQSVLLTLNKLNNADKHRNLVTIIQGLRPGIIFYRTHRGVSGLAPLQISGGHAIHDGAELSIGHLLPPDVVEVHVEAPVHVAFGNSLEGGVYEAPEIFEAMLGFVTEVTNMLEAFIPR